MSCFIRQQGGFPDLRNVRHLPSVGQSNIDSMDLSDPNMSAGQLHAILERVLSPALTRQLLCNQHGEIDVGLFHLAGIIVAYYLRVPSVRKDLQSTLILNLATRRFNECSPGGLDLMLDGQRYIHGLLSGFGLTDLYLAELLRRWQQEEMARRPWWFELDY